ncbi:MAG TPA: CPBP family intramembrane glutamic endopeptidase [Parafilimonas sp.]|nr:CPBP family intramembrane glutamic endopeptidase [Parafilimonas sp.]
MFDYDLTERPRFSPWAQFAILLCLVGVGLLVGSFISIAIIISNLHVPMAQLKDALLNSTNANLSRTIQFISTFFAMALPAIIFARIVNRKPFSYIGFNSAISGKQVFILVGIVLIGLILSAALSELNAMIPLSKSLAQSFKAMEDEYDKQVFAIANMKTVQDYIMSLIIIALLPAIFEEMLFRGCLQPVMINITKNVFVGILLTGILFSALHGSFYGFLPRLALGLILGYIFYFSKNLWLSIIFHFFNNALGITQMYALSRKGLLTQNAMNDDTLPLYYGLIALVALYFAFRFFKKESEVVVSMHNLTK